MNRGCQVIFKNFAENPYFAIIASRPGDRANDSCSDSDIRRVLAYLLDLGVPFNAAAEMTSAMFPFMPASKIRGWRTKGRTSQRRNVQNIEDGFEPNFYYEALIEFHEFVSEHEEIGRQNLKNARKRLLALE
jgi:hypothetical protein